jgi:endonuclease YncB( thermonuclease family)
VRTRRTFGTRGIFANPLGLAMFVGLLAYGAFQSATAPAPASSGSAYAGAAGTFTGHVTRIVDGDTFWISSKDVRIRVWGLDAPERDTPAGPTATAALSRLISGQTLTCRQRDIDRYGRIVGQCFLADGRDITSAMIASGTAKEFCRFSRNHYRTC